MNDTAVTGAPQSTSLTMLRSDREHDVSTHHVPMHVSRQVKHPRTLKQCIHCHKNDQWDMYESNMYDSLVYRTLDPEHQRTSGRRPIRLCT
eukprot:m.1113035 g.1113035  ORF g.1113035 m.1113035 type:complete len:91 (+) comp24363_c0_seq1:2986-3258(+)